MSDQPRDRDDQWGGTDDADDEPEPFVAGVGDQGTAPERDDEGPQARPHLGEDPADQDRIEIGDDDFDLAELEAAVAELGTEDEDEHEDEPRTPQAEPEPGLFEQRRQTPPPSPIPPPSQESAAPPEPPPAAPPTAVPAASGGETEQAESIAALWDLASAPTPEDTAEADVAGDAPSTDDDTPPEAPDESASPEAADGPGDEEVPEPSEVELDLTNFTAKGGSGAAGRSSKRRKGLFRR